MTATAWRIYHPLRRAHPGVCNRCGRSRRCRLSRLWLSAIWYVCDECYETLATGVYEARWRARIDRAYRAWGLSSPGIEELPF